jgi:hypothetical protein
MRDAGTAIEPSHPIELPAAKPEGKLQNQPLKTSDVVMTASTE